jgi:hypothetical protein
VNGAEVGNVNDIKHPFPPQPARLPPVTLKNSRSDAALELISVAGEQPETAPINWKFEVHTS